MSKKYPNALSPSKALNTAYRKQRVLRSEIDLFKQELLSFISKIDTEANEETLKSHLRDFLLNSYYRGTHAINAVDRKDLVIYTGPKMTDDIGVILEVKAPKNKAEMISRDHINAKALQELLLYYLRERITNQNSNIKHLIVTNVQEWYIFDAVDFEKKFASNSKLVKEFQAFERDNNTTAFFYSQKAKPIIDAQIDHLPYTYFDIRDYQTYAANDDHKDDKKLIALYKLLSPVHILKKPFSNDSNSLDKSFYNELLHIIGLEEIKVKNKKLIARKEQPDSGSLIENAMNILEYDISPSKLISFGDNHQERKYNAALELSITWINRILFLKLLEAQLVSYHKGDTSYRFLNYQDISNYDALNKLFFQVLAVRPESRRPNLQDRYRRIPYLNSSLFEPSDVESATIRISGLEDDPVISIYDKTVLKGDDGKRRKGQIKALEYLFLFLDSYDFSTEGSEEIQEQNKNLINAAVLGLIFEKINGYKEGSVFTPGFITMYMCRQTLHQCVITRFNELKGYEASSINELRDYIGISKEARAEANEIINQLKTCDPAVGSGHFLVSMLNEIIALKSYLGILSYKNGDKVRYYRAEIEHDELMILHQETDELYDYHLSDQGNMIPEIQQVQEMLFHEKETLIENCLFGVDINPNSVKICRLRLWIELLKNAYYTAESGYTQLETLPNIDINIKCGNSLVSRFGLQDSLKTALKKSKYSIDAYKAAVQSYKDATDKAQKAEFKDLISSIKNDFQSEVNSKDKMKLSKLENQFYDRFGATLIEVELSKSEQKKKAKAQKALQQKIDQQKGYIRDIQDNQIYHDALEWRFEFPEVLDDEGEYVGFDMVVGNPPYFSLTTIPEMAPYYSNGDYLTYMKGTDIYCLFYEKGAELLKRNGVLTYITSNSWIRAKYGHELKQFFLNSCDILSLINIEDVQIFEEATVESNILTLSSSHSDGTMDVAILDSAYSITESLHDYISQESFSVSISADHPWLLERPHVIALMSKIETDSVSLGSMSVNINRGFLTGYNDAFIIDQTTKESLIDSDEKNAELIKPILRGRDLSKYSYSFNKNWVIATFPSLELEISDYPFVESYLLTYGQERLAQIGGEGSRKKTKHKWYETQDTIAYWREFLEPKIIWGEISDRAKFAFDDEGYFPEATAFFMTGEKLKYLLGILNSKLSEWYFRLIGTTTGMGTNRWKKYKIELLPIKLASRAEEQALEDKVDNIITIKKQDPAADTSLLESEIDQMVYQLYGLTEEEIEIIEKAIG